MDMKQKTLHDMQMAEKVMDCSDIQPILHNERQLIICIHILEMSQET